MSVRIQVKRGTRANLDALAGANGLHQGELYWITDESKFAVGVTVSTYVDVGPGTGGATDLGQVLTGTTVEITSSTGANTVLPEAIPGGNAGILGGARAQRIDDAVQSNDVADIVALTQTAYDALTPDADTLYLITGP